MIDRRPSAKAAVAVAAAAAATAVEMAVVGIASVAGNTVQTPTNRSPNILWTG